VALKRVLELKSYRPFALINATSEDLPERLRELVEKV